MAEYKVTAVSPGPKEWEGKFGPMLTYRMKLEGVEDVVEINKKPSSPAPQKGEVITGTLETNDFGTKFKAERPAFASGSTRGGAFTPRPDHHEEIKAQWAIGQAITMGATIAEPSTPAFIKDVEETAKKLFAMVDRVKAGQSGYYKAKATASTFKKDEVVEDLGEGMTEDNFELGDEPINLEDIPF